VFSNLSAAIRTQSYFTHAEFDVTPSLMLFAEGSLALARNHYNQVQQFNLGGFNGFTIYSGNAFLNPAVQQILTNTNTAAFAMGRVNFDFGDPANATANARTLDLKGVPLERSQEPSGRGLLWPQHQPHPHPHGQQCRARTAVCRRRCSA
jgi:hypothetical protein